MNSLQGRCCGCARFTDGDSKAQREVKHCVCGPPPCLPGSRAASTEAVLRKRARAGVSASHCCLLSPRGRQFWKRVPCPRPRARRMSARAGHFPMEWPPCPAVGPSKRDWPAPRGCWLPNLEVATGLRAEPGTLPSAAAQPCPAQSATAGAAKPSQEGAAPIHPLQDGKLRHRALGRPTPVLFTAPSVLAASRCTTHNVCKAASTAPGKQREGARDCFRKYHRYYYLHDNTEGTEAPGGEVTSPRPHLLRGFQTDGNAGVWSPRPDGSRTRSVGRLATCPDD